MYLHLGQDTVLRTQSIIGVFDLENSTVSGMTRDLLSLAQREGRVVNVSMEMPKSFVLCEENGKVMVYISQISTATLQGRLEALSVKH